VAAMTWPRCRRAAGVYLGLFFLAVAAAPHDHINGFEDLLLDQPSDSGLVFETPEPSLGGANRTWSPFELLQDVPCLACFTRDFAASPVASIPFRPIFFPLRPCSAIAAAATPWRLPVETPSRAPPGLLLKSSLS
jgi:hypothetical protein